MSTTNALAPALAPAVAPAVALWLALLHGANSPRTLRVMASERLADGFGEALVSLPDVDGDGMDELAIGAPRGQGPRVAGEARGAVHLVSARDGRVLWTRRGPAANALYGYALARAGDHDGDGVQDVLVGAPLAGARDAAQILSGVDGRVLATFAGSDDGAAWGRAVAGLDDLDGDGVPEVALAGPFAAHGGFGAGEVQVRSGADGTVLWSRAGAPGDLLGHALARGADMDGDGTDDLLVGVPLDDTTDLQAGAVLVLSARTGAELLAVRGAHTGDLFGSRVARVGDLDGDGRADWAAVAPLADGGGLDRGEVTVHSAADGRELLRVAGEADGELLDAVTGLGDVDGDGCPDLAVGAAAAASSLGLPAPEAGRVRALSGASGRELFRVEGLARAWLGAALCSAGDVDGDGAPDLAAGAPGHEDDEHRHGTVRIVSTRTPW